jgi:cysteine sulfinate desulfinase/cysteine desulfurase-like protein
VLLAMGLPEAEARRVVRLSLGRGTQPEDLAAVADVLEGVFRRGQ